MKTIEEFTAQFIEFAKANGITAEPVDSPHVGTTKLSGYRDQHYITYTHEDERTYEVALNLSFDGGSGQKDAEARGLREFYNLQGPLPINWNKFTGVTQPFVGRGKGGAPPNPPDSEKRVGREIDPGFYQDLGTGASEGETHIQDGVTYQYVRGTTPFSGRWRIVHENHVA